jgi:nucleotide-binding universal stress UspA family protein
MLVTIGDDKTIDPAGIAGVLAFLQHHGIEARHLPRSRGSAAIGETLQAVAISQNADLLVMGAYGHNRLQQLILGGATRAILHNPRLPILLSH